MTDAGRVSQGRARGGSRRSGVEYRWVHLWHWPIRAMHWVAAACMVVLVVTGFYVGRPYFMSSGEASAHFLMGRMRLAHFVAAGMLVGTGIVRVYWLFAGNRFERWRALFPFSRRSLRGLLAMVRYYLLWPGARHPHYLGHNPLEQLAYTAVYALVAFQVLTGFALYGLAEPGGLFWHLTELQAWFPGGIRGVRLAHHLVTWALLAFVPIHVYMGTRADIVDRQGELSSIFSGGRWVPAGERFEDE